MQLVEIPVTSADLADVDLVEADHHRLGLHEPLDAGQLVILHDLDGGHVGAEVVGLDFGPSSTTYHLRVGAAISPADALAVGAYRRVPPRRPHLTTADVVVALRTLGREVGVGSASA